MKVRNFHACVSSLNRFNQHDFISISIFLRLHTFPTLRVHSHPLYPSPPSLVQLGQIHCIQVKTPIIPKRIIPISRIEQIQNG